MDLAYLNQADHIAIAEKIDGGLMSAEQGSLEIAASDARMAQAVHQRQVQARQRALAAERQRRELEAAAAFGAPTRTGTFSESLNNAIGAYAGRPPPSAPQTIYVQPAPTFTQCQRAGAQVHCFTQ
jgi:hypothetical protein